MSRITNGIQSTRRGFTLVELLVVIAIIGLLTSVILPTLKSGAKSQRQNAVEDNLETFAVALGAYLQWDPYHLTPITTEEFVNSDYYSDHHVGDMFDWDGTHLTDYFYSYEYMIVSAKHDEFVVLARPIAPYKCDCTAIIQMTCDLDDFTCVSEILGEDEAAVLAHENRELLAQIRVQSAIAELLAEADDPEQSKAVLPTLKDPFSAFEAFSIIDTNNDAKFDNDEWNELMTPRLNDPRVLTIMKNALRDAATIEGIGESDFEVSFGDLSGDPAELFSTESVAEFISSMRVDHGTQRSLTANVKALNEARERGNFEAGKRIHDALHRKITGPQSKLEPQDARLLDSYVEVLRPN